MLILKELGESQGACAKCLPEKAWKTSGELVVGGGQGTDNGMKKKRIQRESEPLVILSYYTLYTILLKNNVHTVVSYEIAKLRFRGPQVSSESWVPRCPDLRF